MKDTNRRELLKGIGAATGAGIVFGASGAADAGSDTTRTEVSVSDADVAEALDQKAAQVVLEEAGLESFDWEEAEKYEIRRTEDGTPERFNEVVLHAADGATFSVILGSDDVDSTASLKEESGKVTRATVRDGDVELDVFELGDHVTEQALRTIGEDDSVNVDPADGSTFGAAVDDSVVASLAPEEANAFFDYETETTTLYLPGSTELGESALLVVEIDENDSVDSVRLLARSSGGLTPAQSSDPIDCFVNCIVARSASIGTVCWNTACLPCRSAVTVPTCAPCAACAGAIGASCVASCGADQLL